MKKLLLSIMVMVVFASCGKDNKVNSDLGANANPNPNPYTVTNPLLAGNSYAQDLMNRINNPLTRFGQGTAVGTNSTWNALIAQYPSAVFRYTNGVVRNSDIVLATKQTQLINLLNSAQSITSNNPDVFNLIVSNVEYVIDTRYAIQINPSGMRSGYSLVYFVDII